MVIVAVSLIVVFKTIEHMIYSWLLMIITMYLLGHEPIATDNKPFQRYWSSAVNEALFRSLKAGAPPSRIARILTAAQGHSGDWITAYPIALVGTRLDDEALRISVALRVGLNVCLAHQCRCGATVQSDGLHPLSCRFSAG